MTSIVSTSQRITAGLVIAAAATGAAVGAVLTVFGKIVAGAPPATPQNYLWNMAAIGVIAAVVGPFVAWSALRRVPLWRIVVEPLAAGVAGAAIGVLLGSGAAFLLLPPAGIGAAFVRLNRVYRDDSKPEPCTLPHTARDPN